MSLKYFPWSLKMWRRKVRMLTSMHLWKIPYKCKCIIHLRSKDTAGHGALHTVLSTALFPLRAGYGDRLRDNRFKSHASIQGTLFTDIPASSLIAVSVLFLCTFLPFLLSTSPLFLKGRKNWIGQRGLQEWVMVNNGWPLSKWLHSWEYVTLTEHHTFW